MAQCLEKKIQERWAYLKHAILSIFLGETFEMTPGSEENDHAANGKDF